MHWTRGDCSPGWDYIFGSVSNAPRNHLVFRPVEPAADPLGLSYGFLHFGSVRRLFLRNAGLARIEWPTIMKSAPDRIELLMV